jgi:hypothetical protein
MDFADKELLNRYDSMAVVTPDKGAGDKPRRRTDREVSPMSTKVRGLR